MIPYNSQSYESSQLTGLSSRHAVLPTEQSFMYGETSQSSTGIREARQTLTPDGLLICEMPVLGFAVSAAEHNYKFSLWESQGNELLAKITKLEDEARELKNLADRRLAQLQNAEKALETRRPKNVKK